MGGGGGGGSLMLLQEIPMKQLGVINFFEQEVWGSL